MSVLSLLADVKPHLNITSDTDDAELQNMLDAAEAVVANIVGPLAATEVTEQIYANTNGQLVLSKNPVDSVTSITPYGGSAMDLTNLYERYGVVSYITTGGSLFVTPYTPYTVVYNAGQADLPADLRLAVLELVRHLWASQRGSGATRPGATVQAPNAVPGSAYALPIRVEQLLAPYMLPGFA